MASPATGRADLSELDAVVLAGGRGARLGGADKAALTIDGVTLLDRALAAVRGARRRIVVGPSTTTTAVPVVREDPPFSGPVAGLAAGLAALGQGADAVVVLACDLADPGAAVAALLAAWPPAAHVDGVCLTAAGRSQWLTAIYRRAPLQAAFGRLGDPTDRSVRDLLSGLALLDVAAGAAADDVDTWEDLIKAREQEIT